ncbi:MAG: hypothetical protein ABUL77_02030 [Bacteroidota bacterium]
MKKELMGSIANGRALLRMVTPLAMIVAAGCAPGVPAQGSGGAPASGGASNTGGAAVSTGGAVGSGGAVTTGSGGAATGGAASGGAASGGAASGGAASGGASSGGAGGRGGSASGGAGGGVVGAGGGVGGVGMSAGCAAKGYKLCEDFEEVGAVGMLPTGWTAYKGYGSGSPQDVALASDQFHGGKMALKSSSMATGQGRVQKSLASLGATAAKHWGRVFYRFQSPAVKPSNGVMHVTMVGLLGSMGENRVVDIVQNTSGAHQWLFNLPDDSCCAGSAYSWMLDAVWHCAEWYVDVSTHSFRFFADSKEVTQIGFTNKTNSKMANYTSLVLGATFYQVPPSAFVMWFDDLAINDTQIGCQ